MENDIIRTDDLANGLRCEITQDLFAESPRKRPWNIGHFITWNPRYNSPDENSWDTFEAFLADAIETYVPLSDMLTAVRGDSFKTLRIRRRGFYGADLEGLMYYPLFQSPDEAEWTTIEHFDKHEWQEIESGDVSWSSCVAGVFAEALSQCHGAVKLLKAHDIVILPVYMLDHSGISYSTRSFNDPWDSGCVGIIWCAKDESEAAFASDDALALAELAMEREVDAYSQWAAGDVYTLTFLNSSDEILDSVSGVYENDIDDMEEAVAYDLCPAA